MVNIRIKRAKIHFCDEEINAATEVIKSGRYVKGPNVKGFEQEFANFVGSKHAVAVQSGTAALIAALLAAGIKHGDEVITTAHTFMATGNAILIAGGKPVFADVEDDSMNIDPAQIKKAVTTKTKAIMPVHLYGQTVDMDPILELADEKNLKVIEDAAQAVGAKYKGDSCGTFGDIGCFSFYPTKNITTGEGGMLTTNNDGVAEKAKALKAHGIVSTAFERERKERPWLRQAEVAGYNFRLCDVLAAIGVAQMKKVDRMNDERRAIAKKYDRAFAGIDALDLPVEAEKCRHVYQMYTVKVGKQIDRQAFVGKLRESGVQASVHFDPPVHLQPYYRKTGWKKSELRVTESVAEKIVTLPIYAGMGREQSDCVVSAVENALKA